MRSIKTIGMAVVAVLALAVVGVAQASAHEFTASAVGLTIKGKALNTQVFKTSAGTVECTTATPSGKTEALKAETQKIAVNYGNCEAFGATEVSISTAHYDFNANGTVTIESAITINAKTIFGEECVVTVEGGQTVGTVSYKPAEGKITEESKVEKIKSTATGGSFCGSGESSTGTYSGNNLVEAEGGTVGWE